MANDDLKKILDQQSVMNEKLDDMKDGINELREDVSGLKKEVREMSENVDAARGDIENLHMDVRGVREKEGLAHSRNKREIDEIKTHIGLPLMSDTPAL